jgi:hypothetical protein
MKVERPPRPVHVSGTAKGEEVVRRKGREPGRGESGRGYRSARDSSSINVASKEPIHPDSPNIPPQ